ncbi:uncharacterized protein METZ01_LOCUS106547 [marine metagenome]|uniref:Uncharacterized protein n=1 Tax=marine metagenome TaxID=408172 RepID=A0A381WP65_9ZZZZ
MLKTIKKFYNKLYRLTKQITLVLVILIVNLGEILANTIFLFIVFNGIIILIVNNNGQNMLKRIFYVIALFILSIEIVTASEDIIQFLSNKSVEYVSMSNTIWALAENETVDKTKKLEKEHKLSVTDLVRFGDGELIDRIEKELF